jgi:tetratricopeptide (TPR) repeat protein
MKMTRVSVHLAQAFLAYAAIASITSVAWAAGEPVGKVASVQNQVETKASSAGTWTAATLQQSLNELDRVRTGPASRAAILYSDQTLQRINEKSEVEVLPPSAGNPGVLRVISGTHYFSSRRPKEYNRIETPSVTAAIRGTEFVVEVADGGVTTITMIEGVVDASNEQGSVTVTAGEQAYVESGKAPVKRIVVRPRDAVAWSLYYPRVMGVGDEARLQQMGADGESLARAADLLSTGQVGEARTLIEDVRKRQPRAPVALAMASVIELAADRKDEGMRLATEAWEADRTSAAAALAVSFASQAKFDIPRAREMAETAARLAPESAEALARVAEMRMAEGDIRGAKDPAERAVRRDPDSPRALTVLGFIQLAELHAEEAYGTFEHAVAADPTFPMARLGYGLAAIRRGNFPLGREQMQTAVGLDPTDSLLRSYLGKAYFEEKREMEASKEYHEAMDLDPSDPTPHLYDAILKQTYNRPIEALGSLQESIELNDRRGVYRSRMLLDQDLAVRGTDLARIYNDLGFEQLGMVTARRSADADQSNYSSHLFLAGNYRNLPGFATSFLSEVLQARIYQPVSVNSVRPDVVNSTVSYNEYSSLIERPRMRGYVGATYGSTDTDLEDLVPSGNCIDVNGNIGPCEDILELDSSNLSGADATVTFNQERYAGSLSYSTLDNDGFRTNNDAANDVVRGYFTFAASSRDQFVVNYIDGHRDSGDLPLREVPAIIGLERLETDLTNIGVSYRRSLTPASDLVVSAIYSDTEQKGAFPFPPPGTSSTARLEGPQLETQYVLRQQNLTWVAGAGHFDGTQDLSGGTILGTFPDLSVEDTFTNGYAYAKFRNLGSLEIIAGASYEDVTAPVGLLPPRDYLVTPGEVAYEDSRVSAKVGLTGYLNSKTVLRGAAYNRLAPAIGRLQTLEPTQVAGFNQFFNDPGGTWSSNYGVGVDQTFSRNVFGGLSVLRRYLDIPEPTCDSPDPSFGCSGQLVTDVEERHSDDWLGSAYVNGTIGKHVALSAEYAYEQRDFTFTQITQTGQFEDFVETQRLRPQVRVFFPSGLFAGVRATRYDQNVDRFDDLASSARTNVESGFWLGDLQVGYRLPHRWGSITLDALNVTDREFVLYRSSLEETVLPARTVMLSVRFASN